METTTTMDIQTVRQLPIESIAANPAQPRRSFPQDRLEDLAQSIRQHGILQPLTVRRTEDGWQLIAGERRLRAAALAGLTQVPCLEVEVSDHQSALLALVENLQREDIHYLDEAAAIAAYVRETGCSQEETALLLGMSPSALANKLRLLRLSPDCLALLRESALSERHARALLRLADRDMQRDVLEHVLENRLTVAQTERYIERMLRAVQPVQGRRVYILKDVRLFLNSVDRGLQLIRDAGIDASGSREDTEDAILLTIRIPKQRRQ